MYVMDFSINVLTLLRNCARGGLVVDDAIVVLGKHLHQSRGMECRPLRPLIEVRKKSSSPCLDDRHPRRRLPADCIFTRSYRSIIQRVRRGGRRFGADFGLVSLTLRR